MKDQVQALALHFVSISKNNPPIGRLVEEKDKEYSSFRKEKDRYRTVVF
jgi:hypothetical protein